MKKVAIIISPNYKDYAEKYLADCVKSLRKQDYQGEMKIFITDNETSPESFEFLKRTFAETCYKPQLIGKQNCDILNLDSRFRGNDKKVDGNDIKRIGIEIIRNKNNGGFAKGNNDAMKLALKQNFDYIILFNMDTVVESNCVSELVKVAENRNNPPYTPLEKGGNPIGAVQARLMLWPDKDKINSLGNATHFLGFGYCIGYGSQYGSTGLAPLWSQQMEKLDSPPAFASAKGRGNDKKEKGGNDKTTDIFYPSGAAVLLKREVLEKVGLFDEEFWMYNEDQDLGWRIWLAGWKSVLAPDAVVYHKYQFAKSIKQYYWMDRNRIIAMIKNYHFLTLLLILPPFVIMELGLMLFSLKTGWFKEKIKVWKYFLTPAKWKYLHNARKRTQSLRKIKDRDIIGMFSGKIWYQEIDDAKLKLINPVFNLYWKIVSKLIIW